MYSIPETIQLRILGSNGQPLSGATVKAYQLEERPGIGKLITNQVKFQATTDANGVLTLPNVPIDPVLVPAIATGDQLHDNPFGYVDVVGRNGVLLFRVEYNGFIDHAWLDISEANVAFWKGSTTVATFERQVALGGPIQTKPPAELTENNANDWSTWAQGGAAHVEDDTARKLFGDASVQFVTNGGFDNYLRYPRTFSAQWDLTAAAWISVSCYAENSNDPLFQTDSDPIIRLIDSDGDSYQYEYYAGGNPFPLLNDSLNMWRSYAIPLNASSTTTDGWRRTSQGTPDLTRIQYVEIHADTWGAGFTLWVDGLGFGEPAAVIRGVPASVLTNVAVNLDGSGSYQPLPGFSIGQYEWDFEYDGMNFSADATGSVASHAYAVAGQHVVALRVTDDQSPGRVGISTATVNVVATTTTTTVTSNRPSGSVYGQAVTFTASVSAAPGTPTGQVQFQIDGVNLGDPHTLVGGSASFITSALTATTHDITAVYTSDNANFANSQATVNQTVAPAMLTIRADNKSKAYGAALRALTASYSGFVNGDTAASLTVQPTLSTTATTTSPAGTYPITVTGAVAANYTIQYVAGTLTVTPVGVTTTTRLITFPHVGWAGQCVTFTATVRPSTGRSAPTGTVTFMDGDTILATRSLSGGWRVGRVRFTTSSLSVGTHSITAVYSGDANYSGSTSHVVNEVIKMVGTKPTLCPPRPWAVGHHAPIPVLSQPSTTHLNAPGRPSRPFGLTVNCGGFHSVVTASNHSASNFAAAGSEPARQARVTISSHAADFVHGLSKGTRWLVR